MLCTVAAFAFSFASSAEAVTVPVTATPANPIQAVFVDLVNGTSALIASVEAAVGNLALAITGHASGAPLAATASVAAAVGSSPAATEAPIEPPVPAPPSPTASAVATQRDIVAPPVAASDNVFALQSAVVQLTQGMKGLTDLFASVTPSSKIESQIASLRSALDSQTANYNASTNFPLGDGTGLSAVSNIGQLNGVTITNADINAASIPDLSGNYLSVNGGTLSGALTAPVITASNANDTRAESAQVVSYPQAAKKFLHSTGLKRLAQPSRMLMRPATVRSASFRRIALSLE